jgi:hypothetical protein
MNRRRFIAGVLGWVTVPVVALEAPRIFLPPSTGWISVGGRAWEYFLGCQRQEGIWQLATVNVNVR